MSKRLWIAGLVLIFAVSAGTSWAASDPAAEQNPCPDVPGHANTCSSPTPGTVTPVPDNPYDSLPNFLTEKPPAHVVIVVEENKDFDQIIDGPNTPQAYKGKAPYINALAAKGALMTRFYGEFHPSQPNYLALFSGDLQKTNGDDCRAYPQPNSAEAKTQEPVLFPPYNKPNLASALIKADPDLDPSKIFKGYAESLPYAGYYGCEWPKNGSPLYARKHAPWVNFQAEPGMGRENTIPSSLSVPLTDFPTNFADLPKVSFVIPNLDNDMHNAHATLALLTHDPHPTMSLDLDAVDGLVDEARAESVRRGDAWLKEHIEPYVDWAMTHNSLLILTFDEDGFSRGLPFNGRQDEGKNVLAQIGKAKGENNRIVTIFVGPMVTPSMQYSIQYNHYSLLRTLLDMYGISPQGMGQAAAVAPIISIWQKVEEKTIIFED